MTDVSAGIEDILNSGQRSSVAKQVYMIMKPKATGYVALREQVNSLVLHQAMLDKAVRGSSSLFCDYYYSFKGFFYEKLLGERQLDIDELFDAQLDNLFALNFNLRGITDSSRRELESFRGYYSERHKELQRCIVSIDPAGSGIEKKAKEYLALQGELKGMRRKDAKFFETEFKIRELKYEISEGMHKYNIMNEAVLDLGEETRFLNVVEDLLVNSVQLSEHIAIKAKRMERHISATKDIYVLVKAQQKAVFSLDEAVTRLTGFTLGVHNMLSEGLQDMSAVMNSCSNINSFYPSAIRGLGSLVNSVSEANLMRSQAVESAVQRYVSSGG